MYESYLPLLPLTTDAPYASANSDLAYRHVDRMTSSLPLSCSISALRGGFVPIPFKFQPQSETVGTKRGRKGDGGEVRVRKSLKAVEYDGKDAFAMREMRRADVPSVKLLQDACLPIKYPSSFYTILLTTSGFISFLVYSSRSPTSPFGFVSARILSPNAIYLLSLVVSPSYRRTGIARQLLTRVAGEAVKGMNEQKEVIVKLHVAAGNTVARDFYRRVLQTGVAEEKILRRFYKGGDDAVEMQGRLLLD